MNILRPTKRALGALLLFILASCVAAGCGENPVDDRVMCCELADGTVSSETTSDCKEAGGALVDEEFCECDHDVCCEQDDGTFQTLPESQCENVAHPDRCLDVSPDDDVCCKTDDGLQTVPASECPEEQIVEADMCTDEDEEVCCENDDGTFQTLPESQCDNISPDPDLCLGGDEELCCRIDGQFVTVPADQCPDGSEAPADMCTDEDEEVCCETADGYMTIPGSECPDEQEVAAEMCEEEVCCETADGAAFVPADQCEPMSVLDDERCATEPTECVKFRAVDMSALPYTTTAGDTLQSFSSFWGTMSVQTGWSAACLEHPAGAERAHVGVGNDLVLNFAAPVSSIFLLRYYAQTGDELVVPGANLTPTFCGASSYNNITRVDLPTPSSTVTVQDTSPDGGSGYSVLLAECIEWE